MPIGNGRPQMTALDEAHSDPEKARADEDFLRHAVAELELADPQPEEETKLAMERQLLMLRRAGDRGDQCRAPGSRRRQAVPTAR